MCGIWAIFGSDEDVLEQCKCASTVAHRGPDAFRMESINQLPNCCFAFHSLSIMDDTHGMQPMRIRSYPHIWLVYNGEIYNYKKVQTEYGFEYQTESDGECIIHLYNKLGIEEAAAMLDGVFAFCILDTKAMKVFVGRDTYGIKPLFRLATEHGFLAVCSEGKGLMDLSYETTKPTAEIEPFLPGHYEEFDLSLKGKASLIKRRRFHTVGELPKWRVVAGYNIEGTDIYENIRLLLTEATRKRLTANRRIGCMLSGGLDSSLVAALVAKLSREAGSKYPIQTFTIGMKGSPDVVAARKVADHIGSEHHEVFFTAEEGVEIVRKVIKTLESYDTFVIHGAIALYLLSRYISKQTDSVVLFSGEGADELAQGYIHFRKAPSPESADKECRRLLKDLYLFDVLRADRATAAHGLELRFPFLDHYLTSYYLSIPADMRTPKDGTLEKYLIRKAFDKTDLLPCEILWRTKECFSDGISPPSKSWYESLQEFAETEVTDELMEAASTRYPFNPPRTKEDYYYRQIFEEIYPDQAKWTPFYWKQKWSGTKDLSAHTCSLNDYDYNDNRIITEEY